MPRRTKSIRFKLLASLGSVAVVVAAGWFTLYQYRGPRIFIDADARLVGTLVRGSKVTQTFEFVNRGRGSLVVQDIRSGCACTAIMLTGERVEAGSRGAIEVTLDTSTLPEGPLLREIVVKTNDRRREELTLTLQGQIVSEFILEPAIIDFGPVPRDVEVRRSVRIMSANGAQVTVLGVKSGIPGVEAQLDSPAVGSGGAYRVTVWRIASSNPDWVLGNLVVATSSKFMPELKIPIRAGPPQ